MARFVPTRTSSPARRTAPDPDAAALAKTLLVASSSYAPVAPELTSLTPEEIDFIDEVIERASPSATTSLPVYKAYNDILQERGMDPKHQVVYYGKLLKLADVKGITWGEKWRTVKSQQVSNVPSASSAPAVKRTFPPRNPPAFTTARSQAFPLPLKPLNKVDYDDDAFTLHSHQDDAESVATAPGPEYEPVNSDPTPYLRAPRFVRRPISPTTNTTTTTTNSLMLQTGPPSSSYATPRPAVQPPTRRTLQSVTPVIPSTWDAETSDNTSDTPASVIPPSYGAATRGNDVPQRMPAYKPLRALAKAQSNSKANTQEDGVSPVIRHSASSREVVTKARERKGSVLNEDDAWNKVRMAQDEKAADRFREERLVERCWEVWKQGYQWIIVRLLCS